ncbi:uncharacterized protein [Dermacentor andersoni]|uniref:uncharacterized protein n=1 Tax=Dermacentor andersoni TaxID=34620 RepID=UPI003B3B7A2E
MRVPPLSLELDRAVAEFRLFALREAVEFGDLAFSPRDILYPADPWEAHPAEVRAFPCVRLSVAAARRTSRAAGLHVFTDGSYTAHSSGATFVVLGPGDRIGAVGHFRVHAATSAYCAEVIAFAEALAYVRGREGTGEVSIYTDCVSLLQAVATPGSTDLRIVQIKTAFGEIARLSEVRLHHVPGHCGVFGNELADFLASRGARNGFDRKAPLPFKSVRAAFRAVQRARWARTWREEHSDTALFRWVPRLEQTQSFYHPPRARVAMLTEHGRFPFYVYRFVLARDSLCPCGAECESFDHYLRDCRLTRQISTSLEPQEALAKRDLPARLRLNKNRALFIQIIRLVSASLPEYVR